MTSFILVRPNTARTLSLWMGTLQLWKQPARRPTRKTSDQRLITSDHGPHALGCVGGASADRVRDLENGGVAVVELVIEAATVEAVGGAAVADVVEGAVFAELNGIHTAAGRDSGTRAGTE